VHAQPGQGLSKLVSVALDSAPVGLVVLDRQGLVQLVTQAAAELLGLRRVTAPTPAARLLARCSALDRTSRMMLAAALDHGSETAREVVLTLHHSDGPRSLAVDIRPAGQLGLVLSLEDVTESRQSQDWLLEHVSSDPVTGLWNRQHFMLMLQDALAASQAADNNRGPPSVLLVGLHRFKLVNDTLGTQMGDMLLRMVGDRLAGALPEEDMLARSAGNEFAIAVSHTEGRPAIAARAASLLQTLSGPYAIDGQSITLGAQIGIAMAWEDGGTPEDLLGNAALALQALDVAAPSQIRFFDAGLTQRAERRRGLEADLRHALEGREFALHYQAQVDVHHGCVTGLEALIRWNSPSRGLVPPIDFIPLAEEIGLIVEIGDWVLREACREAVGWPEEITVAVNASPLQFEHGDFAASVADALASTGLAARRLEIEITESLLLRDTGTVKNTLAALHQLGVRLVLDDFGTGFASLSQLSRFRFDKIKIDRSFVSAQDAAIENSAIVRSIAALAASLGIPSTAEGVETQAQLEQITAYGCTCVQGYYLSRPVPAKAVAEVLARLHHPLARAAA